MQIYFIKINMFRFVRNPIPSLVYTNVDQIVTYSSRNIV